MEQRARAYTRDAPSSGVLGEEGHPTPDDTRVLRSRTHDLFVGRQRELETLQLALEEALAGRGGLIMLAGEPGIGKTRTAQQFAARAAQQDIRVWWGRCDEEPGAPPLWPWVQALRTYVQAHDAEILLTDMGPGVADIAEMVPDVRAHLADLPRPPHVDDPAQARFRLFDAMRGFLQRAAQRQPVVLFLDNLHWADVPSLQLLAFLAPELESVRLLVIGSYRDVEVSRQHPLSHTLGELTRQPRFQRLRLRGLSDEDVGRFLAEVLGRAPAPELVAALHGHTEGNPLFLTEIVRFLLEEGMLSAAQLELYELAGRTPRPSLRLPIPEGIRDVIGQRLNRLSPGCNRLLSLAAVIGRQFSLEAVQVLLDADPEERVLELLEEAVTARVLEDVPQAPGRYQFTHALIRETLYEELTTARRVRLHQRLGEVLEALDAADMAPNLAAPAYPFGQAAVNGEADQAIAEVAPAGAGARLDRLAAPTPPPPSSPDGLTPREVEVLRLLALGKSNRDIADTLCVSLSTVATHVRNILSKTATANRTEAAAYALRQGLGAA